MTTETRHTPGPWKVRHMPLNPNPRIVGPDGTLVVVLSDGSAFASQTEANAALIATAPELLEGVRDACNLLIGAAAWLEKSGQEPIGQGLRQWVAEKGQAAITKATEGKA